MEGSKRHRAWCVAGGAWRATVPRPTSHVPRSREAGNVLLLSLFALSSILIGSLAISGLVIRDIRTGRIADQGHAAFYAAETGVERSLYALRKREATPASQNCVNCETLSNGTRYDRQVTSGEPVYYAPFLKQDDFIELNLFDPDSLATPPGIEALSFAWQDSCGGCSGIELAYTQWPAGASLSWPPGGSYAGTFWKTRYDAANGLPYLATAFAGTNNYRVRVRARNGDLTNVEVRAYADDAGTVPRDLPSRVFLTATGKFGQAQQALSIQMQRAAPLSGLFGFVIFSEESIVK
jgi:hypothetical protein